MTLAKWNIITTGASSDNVLAIVAISIIPPGAADNNDRFVDKFGKSETASPAPNVTTKTLTVMTIKLFASLFSCSMEILLKVRPTIRPSVTCMQNVNNGVEAIDNK